MNNTVLPHTANPCFQLKGTTVTMMTLNLYRFSEAELRQQFQGLLSQAPRFFENTPVVADLDHLRQPTLPVDLHRLRCLCADFGINLIAIRGGSTAHQQAAISAGLACMPSRPAPRNNVSTVKSVQIASFQQIEQNPASLHNEAEARHRQPRHSHARIISQPVRSGQQVYHQGDLVITAPVSVGAEVLATGNIFAYGPFRGRALAGVNGNNTARIYCTRFEAELVSVNGHYKLAAAMDKTLWKQGVQTWFEDDTLHLQLL